MKTFLKLFKKEYRRFLRDPGAVLIMIIGTLVYPMIYAIPYASEIITNVPIGVIDNDNTALSREFIRRVDADERVDVTLKSTNIDELRDNFYQDKIKGYFVVEKDFQRNILRGGKTDVSIYCDSVYLVVYKQVTSGIQENIKRLSSGIEASKIMKQGHSVSEAVQSIQPFELVSRPLYNSAGGYESYIYPLVLLLILQQTLLVGIGLVGGTQREKNKKTDNPYLNIIAKVCCYSSLYLVHSSIYFIIIPCALKYSVHYNLTMLWILIPFIISVCLLGQMLVMFFKEREYSIMALAALGLPFLIIPGFLWPKEAMPLWVNLIARLVPSTSAMDGMIKLNQMDASLSEVYCDIIILIALCVIYFIGACFVSKKINRKNSLDVQ